MAIDSSDNIQFEYKGLGKALAEGRLRVPLNQREYAWEAEHVNDLYNDLANGNLTGQADIFLGDYRACESCVRHPRGGGWSAEAFNCHDLACGHPRPSSSGI